MGRNGAVVKAVLQGDKLSIKYKELKKKYHAFLHYFCSPSFGYGLLKILLKLGPEQPCLNGSRDGEDQAGNYPHQQWLQWPELVNILLAAPS